MSISLFLIYLLNNLYIYCPFNTLICFTQNYLLNAMIISFLIFKQNKSLFGFNCYFPLLVRLLIINNYG